MIKNIHYSFALVVVTGLICCSCPKKHESQLIKIGGLTQGTTYHISYYDSLEIDYHSEIDSLLEIIDQSMSVYNPKSLISRINRNEVDSMDDCHFEYVLKQSMKISDQTGGAFDVTVGPLINAWGFGFKRKENITQQKIDSIKMFVGYHLVQVDGRHIRKSDPRIQLDFNAIAQGYTVDVIAGLLESKGVKNYLIEVGGEVLGKGKKADGTLWSVGIEKPQWGPIDQRPVQAILTLNNRAIATSGSYRKYFEENGIRYSHTIDTQTGYPARNRLLSVSVLADQCVSADAFATAFMVMGLDRSKEFLNHHPGLEAYFVFSDSSDVFKTDMTDGFRQALQGEFYSN